MLKELKENGIFKECREMFEGYLFFLTRTYGGCSEKEDRLLTARLKIADIVLYTIGQDYINLKKIFPLHTQISIDYCSKVSTK